MGNFSAIRLETPTRRGRRLRDGGYEQVREEGGTDRVVAEEDGN